MAGYEVKPFQKANHCKLLWLIQDLYQCRTLRKACIDGPDYGTKCTTPFPWALKLGQSTNDVNKGISLYIRGVNLPQDILVNFRVYVRKQTSVKPLLDEKYQETFGSERIWESPLLATNDDFEKEPLKEKWCEFWEIHVELMWNEIVKPEIGEKKDTYDALPKLLCFKELGADLKKFYKNGKFSDINIRCDNTEVPAHKAILEARCPYFAQKINSYSGGDWGETFVGLAPPKDKDVMDAFLVYLYTGDIESLMEDGPLPVGIHKCAQRMRKYDLEWLTSPLQLCGYSRVLGASYGHSWHIGNLCQIFKHGDESRTMLSKALGDDTVSFSLHVKFCKSKHSLGCISAFLHLDKVTTGDGVYVILKMRVENREKEKIFKRTAGDMTLNSSMGFSELAPLDDFLGIKNVVLNSNLNYYLGNCSTHVDKMSVSCALKPEKKPEVVSPKLLFGAGCHGWLNLSSDLGQLLMTEIYSDCFIVVGINRFPAHRVILAARSRYFFTVLNSKEDECTGSSKGMEIPVEKDVKISAEMMKIILEEMYTGSSNIKDSESARSIYNFAKFFGIKSLEKKCKTF